MRSARAGAQPTSISRAVPKGKASSSTSASVSARQQVARLRPGDRDGAQPRGDVGHDRGGVARCAQRLEGAAPGSTVGATTRKLSSARRVTVASVSIPPRRLSRHV